MIKIIQVLLSNFNMLPDSWISYLLLSTTQEGKIMKAVTYQGTRNMQVKDVADPVLVEN